MNGFEDVSEVEQTDVAEWIVRLQYHAVKIHTIKLRKKQVNHIS